MVVRGRPGGSPIAVRPGLRNPGAMDETTAPADLKRLERSRDDRMVAGVCGGLARYFDINPAFFRVGFVVLTLLGGAGILIYAAAALVMPDEGKDDSIATAALRNRRERPWPLIGLGLLAVGGAILLSRLSLSVNAGSWFFFLAAGAVILWITRQPAAERTSNPTEPAPSAAQLAKRDSRRLRRFATWVLITLATLIELALIA